MTNNRPTRSDYIVIYWDPTDHWQRTPTRVGSRTEDVKVVQDSIAEYAQANPHLIYMVVLKADYIAALRLALG